MKNKIAILTQPLGHNYGGIIQKYALQKVLVDMGHETVTINRAYDNPHSKTRILASKYKTLFFRHILQSKSYKTVLSKLNSLKTESFNYLKNYFT